MPRTAAKTNLPKTTNMAGLNAVINGCIEILRGVAEMFPNPGSRNIAPITTASRGPGPGRHKKNWKVEQGGKAKAA